MQDGAHNQVTKHSAEPSRSTSRNLKAKLESAFHEEPAISASEQPSEDDERIIFTVKFDDTIGSVYKPPNTSKIDYEDWSQSTYREIPRTPEAISRESAEREAVRKEGPSMKLDQLERRESLKKEVGNDHLEFITSPVSLRALTVTFYRSLTKNPEMKRIGSGIAEPNIVNTRFIDYENLVCKDQYESEPEETTDFYGDKIMKGKFKDVKGLQKSLKGFYRIGSRWLGSDFPNDSLRSWLEQSNIELSEDNLRPYPQVLVDCRPKAFTLCCNDACTGHYTLMFKETEDTPSRTIGSVHGKREIVQTIKFADCVWATDDESLS